MLALGLFFIGMVSRFMFHVPNFSPVIALALFSGAYVNKRYAVIMPVLLMALTDLILGMYNSVFFTWIAIGLAAALGIRLRARKTFGAVLLNSILSAVLFFIISNFGVWLMSGMYVHNMSGLASCFVLAIPFFRNTLLSTLIYSAILFMAYEVIAARVKNTKLAYILS